MTPPATMLDGPSQGRSDLQSVDHEATPIAKKKKR